MVCRVDFSFNLDDDDDGNKLSSQKISKWFDVETVLGSSSSHSPTPENKQRPREATLLPLALKINRTLTFMHTNL